MRIIKQIEIKNFRSFLGTPKPYATELLDLKDVNIFSGANDSGKSNVLRALNLFFNKEVGIDEPLNFDRDFFIGKKERVQKVIEIGITFDLSVGKKDAFLPDVFKITKFYDRNGFRNYTYTFYLKEKSMNLTVDSRASENKKISKIFMPDNPTPEQEKRAERREWGYRVKCNGFLNKAINLEYVPAIRDRSFFAQLFGRVITQIKENEDKQLSELLKEKNKIINWQKTVKNKSERRDFKQNLQNTTWRQERLIEIESKEKSESRLTSSISALEEEINLYSKGLISSISFLPAEFKIGKDLREFFEGFDVGTGSEKAISLNERGDGIQAKFVPKILDFLSLIDSQNKYYLWAIEEPENSAEYKNQQELATEIKKGFSTSKQIFMTTHSEEFLQLYDGAEIEEADRKANLYHVKKMSTTDDEEYSQIYFFDVDSNEFEFANRKAYLDDDLGQSHLRAKYSKELKKKEDDFLEHKRVIDQKVNELTDRVKSFTKPILFVEDKYTQIYKVIWLKLNNIECSKKDYDQLFSKKSGFNIYPAEGASQLEGFLRATNVDFWAGKKVIGLFDFDVTGTACLQHIKNQTYWSNPIQGDKKTGLYMQRTDHEYFYAMLLPIPDRLKHLADISFPSYVEIENLLDEKFLTDNNFASNKIATGNTNYLKVRDDKKSVIWESIFLVPKADLRDFQQLFTKVNELFQDKN